MDVKLDQPSLPGQTLFSRLTSLTLPRWLWLPTLVFVATRLGVLLVAYLAVPLLLDSTSPPPYHLRGTENILLDVFASRWDTGFYISIVEEGYRFYDVPLPSVAFFPLLPLLMAAITPLTGDAAVSGIILSNLALWGTAVFFYRLTAENYSPKVADRAVWYLLSFPMAFYGSAIYTESLFLLTTIAAYYFARRGQWRTSLPFAVAATLCRLVGLIIVPMLLLEWWRQRRRNDEGERPSPWALLAPASAPLGLVSYMAYLWYVFNDALAFAHASAAWGRVPQSPFITVADLLQRPSGGWLQAFTTGQIHFDNWIDFTFVTIFLMLGMVLLAKRRYAEAAFVLLGVVIPFSSGLLMSQRRYMWVLFPAFILLAEWGEHPWVDKVVTAVSLSLLALFTALYANGYWVA
ncbi:MAG: hypothetical protein IPM53_29015 [Anaerolineaceae bacterium]|nr:hypothetical protein [Anaerolineaceae bacterium]